MYRQNVGENPSNLLFRYNISHHFCMVKSNAAGISFLHTDATYWLIQSDVVVCVGMSRWARIMSSSASSQGQQCYILLSAGARWRSVFVQDASDTRGTCNRTARSHTAEITRAHLPCDYVTFHWASEAVASNTPDIHHSVTLLGMPCNRRCTAGDDSITSVEKLQHVIEWTNSGSGSLAEPSMNGIAGGSESSRNKEDTLNTNCEWNE